MTSSSRVNRYKDLREGIKGEAGITREPINNNTVVEQEDDFLSFMNKGSEPVINVEDTLTEAKTFDQIRQESSEEINQALKSVKSNVGKEEQYNTRLDILNKIRHPEKEVIYIDKMDNVATEQFSKGYFVNKETVEEPTIETSTVKEKEVVSPKKKMTLMERLASMSPKDDVAKVEAALKEQELEKSVKEEPVVLEETNSLEDMVKLIKKKDQLEVEKAMQQKEMEHEEPKKIKNTRVSRVEKVSEEKENKVINVLNYVIVALIVVFIVLCVMIVKQIFF